MFTKPLSNRGGYCCTIINRKSIITRQRDRERGLEEVKKSRAGKIYKAYFWLLACFIYLFIIFLEKFYFRLNGGPDLSVAFSIVFFLLIATGIIMYNTRYIIDIELNNDTIVFSTLGKRKYAIKNNFPVAFSGRRRTRSLYLYIEGREYLGHPILYRVLRDQILELEKEGYFKYIEPERRL